MATAKAIWRDTGAEHRAVFVYQMASYRYWQDQLRRSEGGAERAVCDLA